MSDLGNNLLLTAEALIADAAEAAPLSLAWAMYLGSPVSASWLALGPQTALIGRNADDAGLTPDGGETNAP